MSNTNSVEEGNKLIAEFMGFGTPDKEGYMEVPDETLFTFEWEYYKPSMMKYHTSWDWQVPVWSKFFSITLDEYRKDTVRGGSGKFADQRDIFESRYHSAINDNSPKDGFDNLVEAITWYNTIKK